MVLNGAILLGLEIKESIQCGSFIIPNRMDYQSNAVQRAVKEKFSKLNLGQVRQIMGQNVYSAPLMEMWYNNHQNQPFFYKKHFEFLMKYSEMTGKNPSNLLLFKCDKMLQVCAFVF